jgi:predicted acyltransferase
MRIDEQVAGAQQRLSSLDQFRGYTVAAMFLVNFIGSYLAVHELFKHNKSYCSYADTIMPHFFFAVGFAFRLTLLRRIERQGAKAAYRKAALRYLSLLAIGVLVHGLGRPAKSWVEFQALSWGQLMIRSLTGETFQALVHIAVTGLFVLPVIAASGWKRWLFLIASAALHLLLSHEFYYEWIKTHRTIDGGVLGFLSWTIPTLAGALAYDIVAKRGVRAAVLRLVCWAFVFMIAGYALSCGNALARGQLWIEPPFVRPSHPVDIWTMSQKSGAISYQAFGAGFSLLLFALFVGLCDGRGWRLGVFRTLGQNALLAYILHGFIAHHIGKLAPRDAPLWAVLIVFTLFFALTWLTMRLLEKKGIYLKL